MYTFKLAPDNTGYKLTTFASQLLVEPITFPQDMRPSTDHKVMMYHVTGSGRYLNQTQGLLAWTLDYSELVDFLHQLEQNQLREPELAY